MNIALILLILRLIGAAPAIIEMVKALWALIGQIRDRRERRLAKRQLRSIVFSRKKMRTMSVDETIQCRGELDDLAHRVKIQLMKEGKHA